MCQTAFLQKLLAKNKLLIIIQYNQENLTASSLSEASI